MDILISKMNNGQVFRGLMIVNEKANPNYNIDFIKRQYLNKIECVIEILVQDVHRGGSEPLHGP